MGSTRIYFSIASSFLRRAGLPENVYILYIDPLLINDSVNNGHEQQQRNGVLYIVQVIALWCFGVAKWAADEYHDYIIDNGMYYFPLEFFYLSDYFGCFSSTQLHSKARAIRRFLQYPRASVQCKRRLQC
jgi:hypothetical protein